MRGAHIGTNAWSGMGSGGLGCYGTLDVFNAFQRPFELMFEGWGDGKDVGIFGVDTNWTL